MADTKTIYQIIKETLEKNGDDHPSPLLSVRYNHCLQKNGIKVDKGFVNQAERNGFRIEPHNINPNS